MITPSVWRIVRMTPNGLHKQTLNHPFIALAPGCPDERHPTRDCKCKVFRTLALAADYVHEQQDADE